MSSPVLLHGDCLEVMKTLPDKSVDLFVCDLPYGCLSSSSKTTRERYIDGTPTGTFLETRLAGCDWDVKIDLDAFWEQVERLMKDDHTPILHFCNTKFGYDLIKSKESWFRYDLVWNKMRGVGFLSANKQPLRSHEMVYVFAKKGARYYRKDIEGDFKKAGGGRHRKTESEGLYGTITSTPPPENEGRRCVKSVIEIPNCLRKGQHPTQKPAELYAWLIERYSKEGDTILDPTAGSFSSVFTACAMHRNGIGIEKDDGFYAKAVQSSSSSESSCSSSSSSSSSSTSS